MSLKGLYRAVRLHNPLTSFSLGWRGHLHRPVAGFKADGWKKKSVTAMHPSLPPQHAQTMTPTPITLIFTDFCVHSHFIFPLFDDTDILAPSVIGLNNHL